MRRVNHDNATEAPMQERLITAVHSRSMRTYAVLLSTLAAAAVLLTATIHFAPSSLGQQPPATRLSEPTRAISGTPAQATLPLRAWTDPPARAERGSINKAATTTLEAPASEPPMTGTLPRLSESGVPVRAVASHRSVLHPRVRTARQRQLSAQHSSSPEAAAMDEPASVRVKAEPIEFSLASR